MLGGWSDAKKRRARAGARGPGLAAEVYRAPPPLPSRASQPTSRRAVKFAESFAAASPPAWVGEL